MVAIALHQTEVAIISAAPKFLQHAVAQYHTRLHTTNTTVSPDTALYEPFTRRESPHLSPHYSLDLHEPPTDHLPAIVV
jgi:dsRNA-specific ribonuclease